MVANVPANFAHKRVVLVAEDDVLIRVAVAEALRSAGMDVIEVATGDEALTVLADSATVDLVFTDINMPGLTDGLALAQFVRQTRPSLKIIVTSGHPRSGRCLLWETVRLGEDSRAHQGAA